MTFRRRSVPNSKATIDAAIEAIGTSEVANAPSPEWTAVLLASDASAAAGKIRAALGGYVPLSHPDHPSKWSAARRERLADADAAVGRTAEALRAATLAHVNRHVPPD